MNDPSTKHLLISLVTTLNAAFPDYDFSQVKPEEFRREWNIAEVVDQIDSLLLLPVENATGQSNLRHEFWSAVEETIQLHGPPQSPAIGPVSVDDNTKDSDSNSLPKTPVLTHQASPPPPTGTHCEIYSFQPEDEHSDISDGKLWSVQYFFFNKKLKKVVFFSGDAESKLHSSSAHLLATPTASQNDLLSSPTSARMRRQSLHKAAMGRRDKDDEIEENNDDHSDAEEETGRRIRSARRSGIFELGEDEEKSRRAEDDEDVLDDLDDDDELEGRSGGSYTVTDPALLDWDEEVSAQMNNSGENEQKDTDSAPTSSSSPAATSSKGSGGKIKSSHSLRLQKRHSGSEPVTINSVVNKPRSKQQQRASETTTAAATGGVVRSSPMKKSTSTDGHESQKPSAGLFSTATISPKPAVPTFEQNP